jgi:DNA-binding SARP family transcriptional activator
VIAASGSTDSTLGASISLLRGFEIRIGDRTVTVPANTQRLLAFLAIRDRPQLRTTVATSLWTDTTEDRAAANLRSALWKLADLRERLIETTGAYLSIPRDVDVDLPRLLVRARRLIADDAPGDDAGVVDAADTATGDLADDLLPDWDEDWLLLERERLRQLRVHALEALTRRLCARGRYAEALEAGLSAVVAEPLRESAQRALIEVHLAEGNVAEARRQFELYREVLWDHLALLPSVSLCSLVGVIGPGRSA